MVKTMMNDAISRSNLISLCRNYVTGTVTPNDIARVLALDAVPVVRCKDCWKRGGHQCPMFYEELVSYDEFDSDWIDHDSTIDYGFCHCGARMDGESDV
jgi:hypothetical protein